MGEREARVRLTLTSDQFLSKLKQATEGSKAAAKDLAQAIEQTGNASENAAKKASGLGGAFSKALGAVKSDFAALGGQIKGLLGTAATLGGAFSFGSGLKQAVNLQAGFSELAMRMELTGKETTKWADLQKSAQAAASITTRTTDEMRESMAKVYSGTGNKRFAVESMEAIGMAATASGKSVGDMAELAGMLHKKFGAAATDLPGMLERIVEQADSGGQSFEDLKANLEDMASTAQRAGVKGAEGLTFMMSAAKALNDKLGAGKASAGLKGIFETLENTKEKNVAVERLINAPNMINIMQRNAKAVRFGENDSAMSKTRRILGMYTDHTDELTAMTNPLAAKRGGVAVSQFKDMFSGDSKRVMTELMAPFEETFKKARSGGKSESEARKLGLAAFDENIKKLSTSTATGAKLQEAAAAKANEPAAKLRQALETLQQSFQKPEIVQAINDLAAALPALAKAISPLLTWATKNPALAAGTYMAGRATMTGMGSLAGSGASALGSAISAAFEGKAPAAGEKVADGAAKSGAWKTAGNQLAGVAGPLIAAAAILAFQEGRKVIDQDVQETADATSDVATATAGATAGASLEQNEQNLAKVSAAEKKLKTQSNTEYAMGWLTMGASTTIKNMQKAPVLEQAEETRKSLEARIRDQRERNENARRIGGDGAGPSKSQVAAWKGTRDESGRFGDEWEIYNRAKLHPRIKKGVLASHLADDAKRRQTPDAGETDTKGGQEAQKGAAGELKGAGGELKGAAGELRNMGREVAAAVRSAAAGGGGGGSNGLPKPGPVGPG